MGGGTPVRRKGEGTSQQVPWGGAKKAGWVEKTRNNAFNWGGNDEDGKFKNKKIKKEQNNHKIIKKDKKRFHFGVLGGTKRGRGTSLRAENVD